MPDPLTEALQPVPPEEPWWWPLGPAGFVIAMFAGVTYLSWTWPIRDDVLDTIREAMRAALGALVLGWVLLGLFLRRRREARLATLLPVHIDDQGIAIGERAIPWARITRCEWSPYGGLLEVDGEREHVRAVLDDAQAARLQAATDLRLSR